MIVHRFSPTQFATYDECHRKWGFFKLDHVEVPTGDKQQFGITGHAHAAAWLERGTPPPATPEGDAFRQGIKRGVLPRPRSGVMVEGKFTRVLRELDADTAVIGVMDYLGLDGDTALVMDHKFTTDMRYAKTAEDLTTDPQAVTYAKVGMEKLEVAKAETRWVYYASSGPDRDRRRPRGVKPVSALHTLDSIAPQWDRIVSISAEMRDWKRVGASAMDLPPNPLACDAFGGCPFRERCKLTPAQRMGAHLRQFEKIHGPKATHSDIIRLTTKEGSVASLLDKLKGGAKKPADGGKMEKKLRDKVGVNPPEEPEDEAEEQEAAAPPPAEKKKGAAKKDAHEVLVVKGLVVYIDCLPLKGTPSTTRLMDLLVPAIREVCGREKVAHWSLCEFGKGPGMLANEFDKHLLASEFRGAVVVDSSTAEARAVMEVLYARAENVVKGIR